MDNECAVSNYPLNLHIQHLSDVETMLLMTMRLWCMTKRYPQQSFPDWRGGFQLCSASATSWQAMEGLMNIIVYHSVRILDIRCTCQPRLGNEEGCFLETVSLIQNSRLYEAERILNEWLPMSVRGIALIYAMQFAEALREANLLVPVFQSQSNIYHLPTVGHQLLNTTTSLLH